MSVEQIFWDNDGVLVDTERLGYQANFDTPTQWGYAFSEPEFVELFLSSDRGTFGLLERIGTPRERAPEYCQQRDRRYSELLAAGDGFAIDGVEETRERSPTGPPSVPIDPLLDIMSLAGADRKFKAPLYVR